MIEFVQEQSLYYYWTLNKLNYIDDADRISKGQGTVTYLESRFLDTAYNQFLKHKYGSDAGVFSGLGRRRSGAKTEFRRRWQL